MSLEQQLVDLTREFNRLKQQFDNLVKPEVGGWKDISADVSLYQNATVAANVNYAMAYVSNKSAIVQIRQTATAAGSAGNNIYTVLPASLTPDTGISTTTPLGTAIYLDSGTAQYVGVAAYVIDIAGNPAITMFAATITDGSAVGANPNIAIASNDVFELDLVFKIA